MLQLGGSFRAFGPYLGAMTDSPFAELGLRPELLDAVSTLGYEEPTRIQRETIPHLLAGRDLLGQAATGTGKTAAFALPLLHALGGLPGAAPSALVLVPTRELAVQVSEAMVRYGRGLGVRVVAVFGGQPIHRQLDSLQRGVHVVVATPGRALDHVRRGSLALGSIRVVVLDEADEMLDMGFSEDIETLLDATPAERQTVLFSATMPPRIQAIAERYQRDPVHVRIGRAEAGAERALVRQTVYFVPRAHKPSALGRILDVESPRAALVFCRTRTDVDELTVALNARGYRAEALHGGMDQRQRDRVMARLREGSAELLIATDVAARGLDIDVLTHVVNYDVPSAPDSYVHRIGRVGRAGREGVAITLAEPRERRLLRNIERLADTRLSVGNVPTVADLRARRIERTTDAVRDALDAEDLEGYAGVLDALSDEATERDVALAAIKLLHEAAAAPADDVEIPGSPSRDAERSVAYVYIGIGRRGGVRPGDLVGAITGETGLVGRDVGPIRIGEHFSVVGVPESAADAVVHAMRATTIRGRRAKARRYVE